MERLWLRARAPFAAYRAMQAGVYRPSAPTMPPSAAFGLVLNCAGIEMRDPEPTPTTRIRRDVPRLRIAIGAVSPTETATLYQQLHSYPVGASGQEHKARTHGAKYWIAPARRELVVDLDVMIGVEAEAALCERVRRGLRGELADARYGLPFAGDNNLLFDRIEALDTPVVARWYTPLAPGDRPRRGSCRLTIGIDREDSSRTTSQLFAPIEEACAFPPDEAWTWTPWAP
ncbi:CRISPR-associated protein Cas5 [Polyangium mundeleinium]|uniref:CRISPR-associated protein Cas5 n=1 Tax=Polyangium mundeleinium TaxID=2995306 RepID=A0ABT5EDP8_9BACT|nr:CRISPR-associated protein Cas5 [Polyangium mundeleinium]MDC0739936.1 CRISPR-associated protein Cas5 [Polyangium mundeleinium]